MFERHDPPEGLLPKLHHASLIIVADFLRRARDSAARDRRPIGDSMCALGLLAYDRFKYAIMQAVKDGMYDWLGFRVMDDHFVVLVHDVPIRAYPGDGDQPIPSRALKIGAHERNATQLVLDLLDATPEWECIRFEVEKTQKGFTAAVNCVFVRSNGTRLNSWPIPRYTAPELADSAPDSTRLDPIRLDDDEPDAGVGAVRK